MSGEFPNGGKSQAFLSSWLAFLLLADEPDPIHFVAEDLLDSAKILLDELAILPAVFLKQLVKNASNSNDSALPIRFEGVSNSFLKSADLNEGLANWLEYVVAAQPLNEVEAQEVLAQKSYVPHSLRTQPGSLMTMWLPQGQSSLSLIYELASELSRSSRQAVRGFAPDLAENGPQQWFKLPCGYHFGIALSLAADDDHTRDLLTLFAQSENVAAKFWWTDSVDSSFGLSYADLSCGIQVSESEGRIDLQHAHDLKRLPESRVEIGSIAISRNRLADLLSGQSLTLSGKLPHESMLTLNGEPVAYVKFSQTQNDLVIGEILPQVI